MKKVLYFSAILMAAAPSSNAAALIYEGFSQTTGVLNGKPSGTGLSGNWSSNTAAFVGSATLSYPYGIASGGQANLSSSAGTDASVTTTTALADAGLLDDGETLWFSVMFSKTNGGGSNEWAGFGFGTDRVDASFSGINMQNSGNGIGFATRNTGVNVATWSGGGNANQGSGFNIGYSNSTLIVGKIEWGETAVDNETITLYLPTGVTLGNLGTGQTLSVAGFDQTLLDTISFSQRNSSGVQTYDEIRFGATYADVVPEPSSVLLGALGSLLLLRRRK